MGVKNPPVPRLGAVGQRLKKPLQGCCEDKACWGRGGGQRAAEIFPTILSNPLGGGASAL